MRQEGLIVGVLFSMKISIVIPCYNAELYLSECLDSIFANTTVQFEVLLVDDCSVDNTASVVKSYQDKHSNVRLISHAENKGTLEARRSGSLAAVGDYILYVDPDDRITLGSLEKLSDKLDANPVDILCFGHRAFGVVCDDRKLYWNKYSLGHLNICSRQQILEAVFGLRPKMPWSLCVCAWRRELVITALNEIPKGYCVYSEDGCMFFVLCNKAQKVDFVDSVIYEYRVDSGITSSNRLTEWNTVERNIRSIAYLVTFGGGRYSEEIRYWKMFEKSCIDATRDRLLTKLKNYSGGIELMKDDYFKDDMVKALYLMLLEQERIWERRLRLMKPFRFLLMAARSFTGLQRKISTDEDLKIHYKNLHDEYKLMAKLVSSKG